MSLFTRKRHFPVGVTDTPTDPPRRSWVDIACVVFFLICVGLWIVHGPVLAEVLSMIHGVTLPTFRLTNGGEGLVIYAVLLAGVSMPLLVIAFLLSLCASGLPRWFRVLSVLPALAGFLIGVGIVPAVLLLARQ